MLEFKYFVYESCLLVEKSVSRTKLNFYVLIKTIADEKISMTSNISHPFHPLVASLKGRFSDKSFQFQYRRLIKESK